MPKVRLIPFKSAQVRSNPYAIRQRIGIASGTARVRFETASAGLRLGFGKDSGPLRQGAEQRPNSRRSNPDHVQAMFRSCPEPRPTMCRPKPKAPCPCGKPEKA
ncbi:hypothetical protein [Sphingobacterium multivorum]|uniref:hypothetical protein n=1 Tax=Sphingobacterium multivorum TaxID=28454 RepID=UPI0028AF038E|nr:hypothetical protein [Sphingobacterium multivorum]